MKKGKKKIIIIIAIIAIFSFSVFGIINARKASQNAGMGFGTVDIVKESIESHVQTTGEVLATQKQEVASDVGGKVLKVAVEKGQKVTKDQVLVELDSSEAMYQLKQAEIRLDIEKDTLEELKGVDKLELEINMSNAQIQYNDAKRSFEQITELYNQGAVSLNELNTAKTKLEQANNTLVLAERNLERSDSTRISTQEKQIELSELSVAKLKEELLKYTIKSPMDGTVVELNVVEGLMLSPSAPMMVIMDTEELEVLANISEYEVEKIKLGDPVKITGDAIEGQEYEGTVKYIAPTAMSVAAGQGRETVVEIKVGVESKHSALKPGFSATVDILTEVKDDVLVVPYETIFTRKDGQKLIFSVQDGKAKAHEIKTGIESDLVVEIVGNDIKENYKVILNPTEGIVDGEPINTDVVMSK